MNVLIVLDAKLPVYAYGGTERVMWYLAKELAAMKHKVTLLAREGSQCDFAKVLTYRHDRSVNEQIPTDIDIVHFNGGDCAGFTAKPYVVTIHGNGGRGELDRNSIFVSRNHAERFGSDQFVYNGLDWDDYGSINANQVRSDFHFLGNAAWRVKNVKGAIDVVKSLPGGVDLMCWVAVVLTLKWALDSPLRREQDSMEWWEARRNYASLNNQEDLSFR